MEVFIGSKFNQELRYVHISKHTHTHAHTHTHTVTPFLVFVTIGVKDVQMKFEVYLKMLLLSKTKDF
jgi:hypothetical protein